MSDVSQTLLHPAARRPGLRAERSFVLVVGATRHGPFERAASVGAAPSNQVVLPDPTVSRFHFEITRGALGLRVVDVGSTNGTFVNGVRVFDAVLEDGAELRAGDTRLRVEVEPVPRYVQDDAPASFGGLIGESPAMRRLLELLVRLAAVDTPVLVQGETGSGKELVARALHDEGRRKAGPFVVFDCGAVAASLAESELFGHVRGAFTGADVERAGAFERAHGGTLFLDEIGELEPGLQPKLLRALESRKVRPLGGDKEREIDVRVVAATHRDLRQMVNAGTFREDLYHRLAVFALRVPPLRERPEDIAPLARHFLSRALAGTDFAKDALELTPASLARLSARSFSGNVRELRNVIERALVLGDLESAARGDLEPGLAEPGAEGIEAAKRRFERHYLVRLLAKHSGDRAAAAEEAELHVKSLGRLLRRHGLTQREQS
ncbi:MAG: sigma 54-interacting transcriptional regulator [Deltaproteobacteria bacterium]|nr:sigma 54-interacting transcriptional regulator [Deltaproteobacteria bacterium]